MTLETEIRRIVREEVARALGKASPAAAKPGRPCGCAKAPDERDRLMAADYASGLTLLETATKHRCAMGTVVSAIKRCGQQTRPKGPGSRQTADPRLADFVTRYDAGATLDEIGAAHQITRERVRQIMNKAGYGTSPEKRPLTSEQQAAVDQYLGGESLALVAGNHGVHEASLRKWIIKSGHVPRKQHSRRTEDADVRAAEIAAAYKAGLSLEEIATRYSFAHKEYVYRALGRAGVKPDRFRGRRSRHRPADPEARAA